MLFEHRGDAFVVKVNPEHPSFEGHFPGHPILPGVILLDWLILALELHLQQTLTSCKLETVKFLKPVKPGDELYIHFFQNALTSFKFSITCAGNTHVSGSVSL